MAFEMTEVGSPVSEQQIRDLETQMESRLSRDYREFLLKYNGGRPTPAFFPIRGYDKSAFGEIRYFFGINIKMNSLNILWNFEIYHGRLPLNLILIAGDDVGNVICISTAGWNEGFVYFWDHDAEHIPPTYDNVYLVAESFQQLVDSIYFEDLSAEVAKLLGPPFKKYN
jgi:hypothetical protein